jgi:hypothetical protein
MGRLNRWPGASGHPWAIPAEFVSEKYGIPVDVIREKLLADDQAMAKARELRKLNRMASPKGGAR